MIVANCAPPAEKTKTQGQKSRKKTQPEDIHTFPYAKYVCNWLSKMSKNKNRDKLQKNKPDGQRS